jgi:hypothetical protein
MRSCDHDPEVGDVPTRRVDVARERESADRDAVIQGNEHGRVGMPTHGAEVAALVRNTPPLLGGQKPGAVLLSDRTPELDDRLGVSRLCRPDRDHETTIP